MFDVSEPPTNGLKPAPPDGDSTSSCSIFCCASTVASERSRADWLTASETISTWPSEASAPAIRPTATIASSSEKPASDRGDVIELQAVQPAFHTSRPDGSLENSGIPRSGGAGSRSTAATVAITATVASRTYCKRYADARGRTIVTRPPGPCPAVTRPLCVTTIFWTSARPSPVPCGFVVKNG